MKAFQLTILKLINYLFVAMIFFSCKKIESNYFDTNNETVVFSNKTVKQIIFSDKPDYVNSIIQVSTDKKQQRFLIPLKSKNPSFNKYLLIEHNSVNKIQTKTFVISKKVITQKINLFDIPFTDDGVTAFDIDGNRYTNSKLLLKQDNRELNLNAKFINNDSKKGINTSNLVNPAGQSGYCIDHWWITYDSDTYEIISIDFIGSDCYGCAETNSCTGGGGGGGGGATSIDSAALLVSVVDEYNGIHDGQFFMLTTKTVHVPTWASSASPLTSIINWQVVDAEYYKVDAKTITKSAIKPTTFMSGKAIDVIECNTVSTLFQMKKSSIFWRVKWQQGNLPVGIIRMNGTPSAEAECDADGYINIEAKFPPFEIINSMPTITSASTLMIFYRSAPTVL